MTRVPSSGKRFNGFKVKCMVTIGFCIGFLYRDDFFFNGAKGSLRSTSFFRNRVHDSEEVQGRGEKR